MWFILFFKTLQSPLDKAVLENTWKKAVGHVASPNSIQHAPYCEKDAPATLVFLVVAELILGSFTLLSVIAHFQQLPNVPVLV